MNKECAICGNTAMDFVFSDKVLEGGKARAEVCLFCDRHAPPKDALSPNSKEMWKAAAAVANYLEIRLKDHLEIRLKG